MSCGRNSHWDPPEAASVFHTILSLGPLAGNSGTWKSSVPNNQVPRPSAG